MNRTAMPHPESDRLRRAMERCTSRAVRWSGVVYRSASPRYANQDDLLTGIGSKSTGARWNPPRSFPTHLREPRSSHGAGRGPSTLPPLRAPDRVCDAAGHGRGPGRDRPRARPHGRGDPLGPARLGTSNAPEPWREEQAAGREALTQALGRLAYELGWEALVVPSAARRGGVNLIIFPDNLTLGSAIEIVNVGELPAGS